MAAEQLQVTPIAASIENAEDWGEIAQQILSGSGLPTVLTPELLVGTLGSAVALLFAADAAKDVNLLRGTFADPVIAQCQRNLGCMEGEHPTAVAIHLVGAHMLEAHPVLRARLAIQVRGADLAQTVNNQFWDLQIGAQVTVGQLQCPNCGAPMAQGELICTHCHADVRSVMKVPIVVSRLELY
jgi:hypothetical protein